MDCNISIYSILHHFLMILREKASKFYSFILGRKMELTPEEMRDLSPEDQEIDDFLRNPIDSRQIEKSTFESPRSAPSRREKPTARQIIQLGIEINTANFDWDSQIKRISSRYAQRRNLHVKKPARARRLPDIVKREIMLERKMSSLMPSQGESKEEEEWLEEEETVVYPLRKDQIPNIRSGPGILKAPKCKRRFA